MAAEASAICEERIRRGGMTVERLNCSFRPADGQEILGNCHCPEASRTLSRPSAAVTTERTYSR